MPIINPQNIANTFLGLVKIDSPSRYEGEISAYLKRIFNDELNCVVKEDDSGAKTGCNAGNLYVNLGGDDKKKPLFFNAHMDTVEPGRGVNPIVVGDIIKSDGTTVLGSDDKAAIAILIEVARYLKQNNINHCPLEFIFTTAEEIGLLGAKEIDTNLVNAKDGYALDATDPLTIITHAPCAIRFQVTIKGKAAHAGIAPEQGINSIQLACKAISNLNLGKIDEETTANIGIIKGGVATNIIPEETIVHGEVRSHNLKRLKEVQDNIISAFFREISNYREVHNLTKKDTLPLVQAEILNDYPIMAISEEHDLVKVAIDAAKELGKEMKIGKTGGGSDANIFNGKGLNTVVLGIGMQKVHSTEEYISIKDMSFVADLVLGIIKKWG